MKTLDDWKCRNRNSFGPPCNGFLGPNEEEKDIRVASKEKKKKESKKY